MSEYVDRITIGGTYKRVKDTTLESKQPSHGGTDLSLVTTGEKYTWNNKGHVLIIGYQTGTIALDKTWQEIFNALQIGTAIIKYGNIEQGDLHQVVVESAYENSGHYYVRTNVFDDGTMYLYRTDSVGGYPDYDSSINDMPVQDVQAGGVSVVNQHGVAEIPNATINTYGVVKLKNSGGIYKYSDGIGLEPAVDSSIKAGANQYLPIVPYRQHMSTFYGLAKLAGADMKDSSNAIGTYTDDAKLKIQQMFGLWTPKWSFSATCEEDTSNFGVSDKYDLQLGDVEINIWEELIIMLYQTDSELGSTIMSNNWGQITIRDTVNQAYLGHGGWLMGTSPVIIKYKRFPNVMFTETGWCNSINTSTPMRAFMRSQDYVDTLRYLYVHCENGVVKAGTRLEAYVHRFI